MRVRVAVVLTVLAVAFTTVAWADNTFQGFQIVRVIFNNREVQSDVPAINVYGRTMLPLRKMAELAGVTVDRWDPDTNTAYLSKGVDPAALDYQSDQSVATVNGEKITKLDLYNRMAAETGAAVISSLIREKLIDQAAEKAGVTVSTAEVDKEITRVKERVGGEEKFQQALVQNRLTLALLRTQISFNMKVTKILTKEIVFEEKDIRQFFEDNKAQFDKRQVHARHILVATEQEAKSIRAQLETGASFATLAMEKSVDPSAKANGGDLGTFGVGRMVAEFEKVVFSLKEGEVSAPFQTAYGWHVAQALEITGKAPTFELMKADVTQAYTDGQVQKKAQSWLNDLHSRANITNTLEQK